MLDQRDLTNNSRTRFRGVLDLPDMIPCPWPNLYGHGPVHIDASSQRLESTPCGSSERIAAAAGFGR